MRQAKLVCPSPISGADRVTAADVTGTSGRVTVTTGGEESTLQVPEAGTSTTRARGASVLATGKDLAPGLLAARSGEEPQVGTACREPRSEQWFTGVAAGPERSSVLELVNPDQGPAVVDVTVLGPTGELDVPRLRGVRVDGGERVRLDLADLAPTTRTLSLKVSVTRGRAASFVTDRTRPVGGGEASNEWLPPQDEPRRTNVLLGLPRGSGGRTLVVANPGTGEVRVGIRVVTGESSFAPTDADELAVPPGSTAELNLGQVLGEATGDGAAGLVVESPEPVTATLRTTAEGDLSHTVSGTGIGSAAAIVPGPASRLVLSSGGESGTATVRTYGADGRELGEGRVEVDAGSATTTRLAERVAVVRVEADPAVVAAVVADGAGHVVRPVDQERRSRLVPAVRPGQPS